MSSLILMMIFFVGVIIAVSVFISVSRRKKAEKKAELVNAILLPALNQVFTDLHYSEAGHISHKVVKASKMVSGWSYITGSDYISGRHNGLQLHMSDVTLTHTVTRTRTNSKGEQETYTETVTDFCGQWVICDFNKAVATPLTLRAGGRPSSGFFRALTGSSSSVEMDNAVFNDEYTVLTDNPHDAFYILTPPVMERIMATNEWADGRLSLEFLPQGEVHLAINSGHDFFEPRSIWREMDYERERNEVLQEMYSIISLIDQLRLVDTSNRSV